ncbi:uncharacterized protein LOC134101275 [Sardina pilchardus]|uniref:uncharacterized protein LOC134101275 n=1 Tax=Sardina pilchardus TaxID=27697 RepID=UPI002E154C7A
MEHNWKVVEFADKGTAVVPHSWESLGTCAWPPRDVAKATRQRTLPAIGWQIFKDVRCLAICDTYEKACQRLKKTTDPDCATSDIDTEPETVYPKKRKLKPNRKYSPNLYEEDREAFQKRPDIISPDVRNSYRAAADVLNWEEDDTPRATNMMLDSPHSSHTVLDTHRATNMMSDTHRATNMVSDTHRATNMMSDTHRATNMMSGKSR